MEVSAGDRVETYQVAAGLPPGADRTELANWALTDAEGDVERAYDGLRDPEVIRVYARALADRLDVGELRFRTADPEVPLEVGTTGRVLGAEQSNTSVVLGESLLLKVFRRVSPGVSPDLELHRALGEVDCPAIAVVRAWIETDLGGEPATLAMAQDFATNSADGWEMALTSVRDLFAEADLHAEEVGTDFAGEASRIGAAVAQVHAGLAEALGAGAAHHRRRVARRDVGPARRGPDGGSRAGRRRGGAAGAVPRRRGRGGCRRRWPGAAGPRRPAPGPGAAHPVPVARHRLRG